MLHENAGITTLQYTELIILILILIFLFNFFIIIYLYYLTL